MSAGDLKLASAGHDIRLWDCNGFSLLKQYNPHNNNVSSLCWGGENSILVSASTGGDKIVLTYLNQAYYTTEVAVEEGRTCIALSSSSRYVLGGGQNGHISIWDLKTKKMRRSYNDHKAAITCICFNYNDTDIASSAENGEIILYNVLTGQGSSPLSTSKASAVRQLKYNNFKHSMLGSVSDDGCVNLWDTNKRCLLNSFTDQHKAPATGLAFSPYNEMLMVSVGLDKRINCYDVRTYQLVQSMVAESPLTSVDMAGDGGTVAVGTTRGKISIYDLRQGTSAINMIAAHKSSVQVLSFQNHRPVRVSGSSSNRTVNSSAVKHPHPKPTSATSKKTSHETNMKPESDINANQTGPASKGNVEDTHNLSEPSLNNTERKSSGFNEIFSPLRETSQRASYEEGEKYVQNKSANNSANPMTEADTIYSPLRKNTDKETLGQRPALGQTPVLGQTPTSSSRPWAYSASRVTSQGEPVVFVREVSQDDESSSPGSRSASSSQDDQDAYLTTGPPAVTRQSSDPARCERRQLPSPRLPPAASRGNSEDRQASPGTWGSLLQRQLSDPLGTPGGEAGAIGGAVNGQHPSFQIEVIRNLVEEAMEDVREELRRDILNMHMEMIKRFHIQQEEMRQLLHQYSVNNDLLAEIEYLKEENKKLKHKF